MNVMFNVLYYIVLGIPNAFFHVLIWKQLTDSNQKTNKSIDLIVMCILALMFSLIHDFISSFLRIILILVSLIIINKITYKNDIKKSIALGFYGLIMLMIAELLFGIVYSFIMNNPAIVMLGTRVTTIIMNLCISLIAFGLFQFKIFKKLYTKLDSLFSKLSDYYVLILSLIAVVSINFLFVSSYYKADIKWLIIIDMLIVAAYVIIVFRIFSVENEFVKINDKYNTTLTSLKEYEEILDRYKIMNHENKNDLLMIRSMFIKKEKNIDKYIDQLIDTKIKDDEKLMYETSVIPSGGLRAVIYSKLLIMKDKKINNILHVDKQVRRVDLSEYGDEFVLNLCKIVSIYIDNAIEATMKTKKKEILLQLYLDSEENFNISITNTFTGEIDLSKIDTKGYSTKGDGRGYGLALANEILSRNKDIKNERKIDKNTFTQAIVINKKSR